MVWNDARKLPLFEKLRGHDSYYFEYLNRNGERVTNSLSFVVQILSSGKHVPEINTPLNLTFFQRKTGVCRGIPIFLIFIPRHLKKCGVLCYTLQKKFAFECPSVRPSVRLSVCLSVRQRFVSGLYLEHLLIDFLQTLYRSSYQEGVVWD